MTQIKQKEQVFRFAQTYLAGGLRRSVLALTLAALISGTAVAQYPGGGTRSYGSKGAIIGGVAAGAAVGAGLLYWKLHNRTKVQGCVSDGGDKLVSDSDNHTYVLTDKHNQVRPGDRVELLGKKTVDKSGDPTFEVYKMTRNLGQCTAT